MDKKVAANLPHREIVKKSKKKDGTLCVSGGSDLKASQAYPRKFGLCVAESYHSYITSSAEHVVPSLPNLRFSPEDIGILESSMQMPAGI